MDGDPARTPGPDIEPPAAPAAEIPMNVYEADGAGDRPDNGPAPAVEILADGVPVDEHGAGERHGDRPPGSGWRRRLFGGPVWRRYPPGAVFIIALLAVLTVAFAVRTLVAAGDGFDPEDDWSLPFPRQPSGAPAAADPATPELSPSASAGVGRSQGASAAARPSGSASAGPGAVVVPPPPPSSAVPTESVAAGRRLVGIADKCAEVAGGSTADGTPIQLASCTGAANQLWQRPGDGTVRALGKCLDVQNAQTSNFTGVQLSTCNATNAQVWQIQDNGTLRNALSDRCLDASAGGTSDGTRLLIFDCHGRSNQVWQFA